MHRAVHSLECALSSCPLFRVCIGLSTPVRVCIIGLSTLQSVHYRAWRFRCRSVHAGEIRCRVAVHLLCIQWNLSTAGLRRAARLSTTAITHGTECLPYILPLFKSGTSPLRPTVTQRVLSPLIFALSATVKPHTYKKTIPYKRREAVPDIFRGCCLAIPDEGLARVAVRGLHIILFFLPIILFLNSTFFSRLFFRKVPIILT